MANETQAPAIRELFIEELADVQGGAPDGALDDVLLTTQACCEELIFDRCCF